MRIAVDLDGTVYEWDKTARYLLRRRFHERNESVPYELMHPSQEWDSAKETVPEEDWEWLWAGGIREGLFRCGHIVHGARDGVAALTRAGHDVLFVTKRPRRAARDTLGWVSLMFGDLPILGVMVLDGGEPKSSVRPPPDVFVDDNPHIISDVLKHTYAEAILFDQPWNRRVSETDRLTRARRWTDVVNRVNAMEALRA